jgi:hypothetical protein
MPTFNILASSGSASQISSDGSRFSFQLNPAMEIPQEAKNVTVSAEASTIWWTVPNIIDGVNNVLSVTGPNVNDIAQTYSVIIPQGLYDLAQIEAGVHRALEDQQAKITPEPLVSFLEDNSTQRVIIRLNYINVQVLLGPQSPYTILGFNPNTTLSRPPGPINNTAPNVAAFNTVNSFLIHSDLVNEGIRVNNTYAQVISQVLIDVAPGSQIVNTPFRPPKLSADNLRGKRDRLEFWLTDDQNRAVNTNGEFWTTRVAIHYE